MPGTSSIATSAGSLSASTGGVLLDIVTELAGKAGGAVALGPVANAGGAFHRFDFSDMARTLETIAEKGATAFYDGPLAAAIDRAKALFGADHANVQPHSGSQANAAVYFATIKPGDKILTMNLSHGGHLTHGHPLNFSGKLYTIIPYGVRQDDERIDYDEFEALAVQHTPKLIVVGASAYPRVIDFARMAAVAVTISVAAAAPMTAA